MSFQGNRNHTGSWVAAIASAIGAAVFLLWQPVADFFVNHAYDDNIVLQIDSDSLKLDSGQQLMVLRVRVANRGNVPVKLISQANGELVLEVKKIVKLQEGDWIDTEAQPSIAKRVMLKKDGSELSVAPNSYWAKEVALSLPKGAYIVRANLTKQDGSRTSEEVFVELGK